MSKTAIRRMTNYQGLSFGQGPTTFSSSPLWSPYGQNFWNKSHSIMPYGSTEAAPKDEVPFLQKKFLGTNVMGWLALGAIGLVTMQYYKGKMPLKKNPRGVYKRPRSKASIARDGQVHRTRNSKGAYMHWKQVDGRYVLISRAEYNRSAKKKKPSRRKRKARK